MHIKYTVKFPSVTEETYTWKGAVVGQSSHHYPTLRFSFRSLSPIKTLAMASPVTGDFNSTVSPSDHQLTVNDSKFPNTAEDSLIPPQLAPKTSSSQPNAPYTPSLSKRKKSKPVRFEIARTDVQKQHLSPSAKSVGDKEFFSYGPRAPLYII